MAVKYLKKAIKTPSTDDYQTREAIQNILNNQENLNIIEGTIEDLIIDKNKICGAITHKSEKIYCGSLVLTTGTFLRGLIRIGKNSYPAGRIGDKTSVNLAKRIATNLDEATDPWGIDVQYVELTDMQLPQELTRAMAKEAEADREARARVVKAGAEREA